MKLKAKDTEKVHTFSKTVGEKILKRHPHIWEEVTEKKRVKNANTDRGTSAKAD